MDEMGRQWLPQSDDREWAWRQHVLVQYFAQVQLDTNRGCIVYVMVGLVGRLIRRCRRLRLRPASITMQVNRRSSASWRWRLHWLIRREQQRSPEWIKSGSAFLRGLSTGIWWVRQLSQSLWRRRFWGNRRPARPCRMSGLKALRKRLLVKADTVAPQLQQQFFEKSGKPLETKQ